MRRNKRDTMPDIPITVVIEEPEPPPLPPPECFQCLNAFRESPGNWHIESPSPGLCNVCHYANRDWLNRPYSKTKIGFG